MLVASAAGRGGRWRWSCGEDDREATHVTDAGEHTRIACGGGKGGVH